MNKAYRLFCAYQSSPWRIWYDKGGKVHRSNGPAVETDDGHKMWYQHGSFLRGDKMASNSFLEIMRSINLERYGILSKQGMSVSSTANARGGDVAASNPCEARSKQQIYLV